MAIGSNASLGQYPKFDLRLSRSNGVSLIFSAIEVGSSAKAGETICISIISKLMFLERASSRDLSSKSSFVKYRTANLVSGNCNLRFLLSSKIFVNGYPNSFVNPAITKLRNLAYDQRILALTAQVSDPALSHEERVAAIGEQQQLRSAKRQPLQPLTDE